MMNAIFNALMVMVGNAIVTIDYVSKVRMNKGGRSQSNVLYDHKVVKYVRTQMQLGNIYENSVNNRSEKECGERSFQTESIKGKKWVKFPYLLTNFDNTKVYVRFYEMRNAFKEIYYMVDGHIATDEEMAIIKEYEIVSKPYSVKQAENGLTENQVVIKDVQIDNILRLSFNGMEFKVEDYVAMPQKA